MCTSEPPAHGPNLQVSFYPGRRLMVQCYKKFIAGPSDRDSQRVNNAKVIMLYEIYFTNIITLGLLIALLYYG